MQKCPSLQREKTCQKVLDKRGVKCYNMQAVQQQAVKQRDKISRKKLKKLLKNLLTKGRECDIMSKHFRPRQKVAKNFQKKFSKTS